MSRFTKILIANRGEIAVRVIRSAKLLGYRTVAVFSEVDREALHVKLADQAVCIGPAAVGESYLVIDKMIEAAKLSGADAIHPGYGFLSENTVFAQRCIDESIAFIGPSAEAIELMGNKRLAKLRMIEAGVPCIPGYEGSDQSDDTLVDEAIKIGMPVMVKAAAGGGGRGMRLVNNESDLLDSINGARSEAQNAFGSGELILEKAVMQPRHVEIQVFGDEHGHHIHLGERDCSIQRRHQKVVEESPSPAVTAEIRNAMGQAAVDAAKTINYVGAGTVEFLLDSEGKFYFLEMNTRLQVEHPVTEEITGVDLVEWQLLVAQGEPIPLKQEEVTFTGHAIEVRLYAENPYNQFLPQTGTVLDWKTPEQAGLRVDHCVSIGQEISPFYDPMIAKIIVHAQDRETAQRKLLVALEDTVLHGVQTNKNFLSQVVGHPVFVSGQATTAFIEQCYPEEELEAPKADSRALALAALLFYYRDTRQLRSEKMVSELLGWHSGASVSVELKLSSDDETVRVKVQALASGNFTVSANDASHQISVERISDTTINLTLDGLMDSANYLIDQGTELYVDFAGNSFHLSDLTLAPTPPKDDSLDGIVRAPMDGRIIAVNVAAGDVVEKGQTLFILEAMKMEHQIKSNVAGTVTNLPTTEQDQVAIRQVLAEISVADVASEGGE